MYSLDEENRGGLRPATAPHRPRSAVAALLATDAGRAVGNGRAAPDPRPKQLFDAALLGELSVATRLLEAGVGPNAFRDQFGSTPLLVAARGGHRRLCTALIEAGADVNAADATGATPLAEAVRKVRPDVVKILLTNGADATMADKWSRLPLAGVLTGPQSTPAERSIGTMLGATSAEEKQRLTSELGAARHAARAAEAARAVAEAEMVAEARFLPRLLIHHLRPLLRRLLRHCRRYHRHPPRRPP